MYQLGLVIKGHFEFENDPPKNFVYMYHLGDTENILLDLRNSVDMFTYRNAEGNQDKKLITDICESFEKGAIEPDSLPFVLGTFAPVLTQAARSMDDRGIEKLQFMGGVIIRLAYLISGVQSGVKSYRFLFADTNELIRFDSSTSII